MSTTEPETTSSGTSEDSKEGIVSGLMNGKRRSSSGKKSPIKVQAPQTCTWCAETKTPLKYVLPTQNGKKEFCSESCIAEFRKAYSKGACVECDNAIRGNAPSREFCSTFCMNKNKKKNSSSPAQAPSTSQNKTLNNNNNSNLSNNNKQKTPTTETNNNNSIKGQYAVTKMSPMFQYEALHVFDWKEYLKVSQLNAMTKFRSSYFAILGKRVNPGTV